MTIRQRKLWVHELLSLPNWEEKLPQLQALPANHVVGPLFAALLHPNVLVRWHAVTAFGLVVGPLAQREPEQARIIMRRFLWSLNDESGGIGWGAPEAMAEIMVQSPRMADEYAKILRAFIHEAAEDAPDCYLEHEPLRRGAMWGLGRLAEVRPKHVLPAGADILAALQEADSTIRGYAAWATGTLRLHAARPILEPMVSDLSSVEIYRQRQLIETTVGALAAEALALQP
jgi:HEAT repeat protein